MAQPVVVSSCINYKWKYDVFLSFRGEDTRQGFVAFLRESLLQRGIRVFYDDDSIRTGEEITPALFKAIQESRIAIIVFSENYADSTFCLRELEKILECFIEEGQLVYPVFYYVDPSELRDPSRHQTGSYAKALAKLEERFEDDKQKVEKWRLALSQAAKLKGCHLKFKISNEQECIKEITNEVSAKINHNPALHVTDHEVGLVSRVKQVVSLLDLSSKEENKMVGIVGPGGIGKSTIARATYNWIGDHFECLCFLSNVRQKSKVPKGLEHLQEELLWKSVMEKDLKLGDFHEGIQKIKHRLGHKKILLILDDVDELQQLKALAGSCSWFGPGSRIVVTTRDKHLLPSHEFKIYDVKELNDEESLQLLSWHAFKTENVEFDFIEVSKCLLLYSCGFPLAIEVIGSNLRDKRVDEWHSALDEYKTVPEGRVFGVLRLSYDSLTEIQQKIFLDLACFFNGEEFGEVKDMLLCLHGKPLEYAIGVLIDKSLIKIEGGRMLMHDLIEDMGKEIVRQESPNEPRKRSRLWCYKDILQVLRQNTGTNKVEVIVLDLPEGGTTQIQCSKKAFMKMKNLKMLVINNASFSKCPKHLPNSLRWLKWKEYPFKVLPSNISSTELFCLDLSCSSLDTLQPFTKMFHTLSRMNFRNCKSLHKIPDLSGVSHLRELWLDGCTDLVEIHHSIGRLNKLKELSAMRCNKLKILPPDLWLPSLEQLNLFGCSSLHSFPDILVEMKHFQTLDIGRTTITELPSSIRNLIGLETLNMEECPYLEKLPTTIYLLPNLWALNANFSKLMTHFEMCEGGGENFGCYAMSLKLRHFCFSKCNLSNDSLALCLSSFTNMIRLDLSFNKFKTLPACIKEFHHMRYLLLDYCKRLQHIEEMPPNLEKFSAICCKSLTESSKSKVLYQALNLQTGKTNFILPGAKFPENLDNYSRGSCVSFWIRDVFPTIFLWIVVKHDQDFLSNCTFLVHVNDTKLNISSVWHLLSTMNMGHLCICELQSMVHKVELRQGNRWNHVKVSIKSNTQETKSARDQFDLALHVYKQPNNSGTIRFMDPRTVYADSNSWQRVQQPQDLEELEDDVPSRGLAMVSLKAQCLPKEDLKVKRAILPSRWTYDVFLSYRGDDECSNFVSHLFNSLCEKGIHVFKTDQLVKTSGEELEALQESRTTIIVISKNYASSPSCLKSLAIIHEHCRIECQFIYPIFYDVEPLELRDQTGSYREVFAELEKIFKHVQKWRLALSEAVDSRGMFNISSRLVRDATEDEDTYATEDENAIEDEDTNATEDEDTNAIEDGNAINDEDTYRTEDEDMYATKDENATEDEDTYAIEDENTYATEDEETYATEDEDTNATEDQDTYATEDKDAVQFITHEVFTRIEEFPFYEDMYATKDENATEDEDTYAIEDENTYATKDEKTYATEDEDTNATEDQDTYATEDKDAVQFITHEVFTRIEEFPFYVEYFSVRFESRVQKVISLMDVWSNEEVKMLGICGGRIRRSTMARAVCNSIARHFEDLWYFSSVSSSSILPCTNNDLSYAINMKLPVYEIVRGYGFTLDDFHNRIRQLCFSPKKILVILDGVEVLDQLGAIRECDRFSEGSRIIVVTRDKQLLVSHGVEIIYDDECNSALDEEGKNPKEEEYHNAKLAVFPSGWSYDVFLSYIGDDKCSSFVHRLEKSLCQRGVRVLVNNELVKSSRENLKALHKSRTAIIVISKNYASSSCCLNSLAIIHDCFRMECRFIYPIFYYVEPLELQHQTGSYREIFARLGKMFKNHVQKWRLALSKAADSRGMFNLSSRFVTNATEEDNVIQLITHEVCTRIEEFPFHIEYFSGRLESQVQKVISLVDIESNEKVKIVGICGGRIRRSTMARAVCNSIARHFEDLWYFSGVSSSSILPWTNNDLSYAIEMKMPVYEIARGYGFTLDDLHNLIRQPWFTQKKILVILDGDEVLDQLGTIRECDWSSEGSRIIVVTRDKQLLASHSVEIIYDEEWNSALDERGKNPMDEKDLNAKLAVFPSRWSYDVFLSYSGDDKCSSFVHYLEKTLCQRGVRVLVNNELVKSCRENLKAIQESRTAIIVISKNYASSPSCLNSLAIIHDCFRMECRFIYPIFYDMKPLQWNYTIWSFGEAFARRGEMFKQHVQKWRLALSKAAYSRGMFNLRSRLVMNAIEDEDIQLITHEVLARLSIFPLSIWDDSVGIESQVQKVISLVDIESNEEVKMVGICGIRKSAIARAVCNVIARHFEDLWYFHGVHEIARASASTWNDFLNRITQPWFPMRKILVILDGIEELDQLGAIRDQFGEGSTIIVVTSDKQLLLNHDVKRIYDDECNSALKEEEDLKAKRSVLPSGWTYDVFLCYRGGDECSGFIRRLYNSLCQRGVRVFVNDELVKSSGEEMKAMKESRTAIIVISKSYTCSKYCWDSLVTIFKYFRIARQFISPIFYDVKPSSFDLQMWGFLKEDKVFDRQVMKQWSYEENLRGMFRLVTYATEDEDKDVIQLITHEVLARLSIFPLSIWDDSVGIESRVQKVISLVDIESNEEVKMVGICGIRKSAIARAVCNVIARHFEDLWYFHGVHEIARGYASTWDDFLLRIKQPWFPKRKILVLLDGVEVLDQLRAIRDLFVEGSTIIVVTSNKQLLLSHDVKIIYDDEWDSTLKKEDDLEATRLVLPYGWTYDVFLSYMSGDECSSFVCRLYKSLCRRGFRVFVNDELVKTSGEEIRVRKESRIGIIVISKNYACSTSCLDSLATIFNYFTLDGKFISPIFYDVEPSELPGQMPSFMKVVARDEKSNTKLINWRLTLSEVANSNDMFSLVTNATKDEDAIQSITHEVSARIKEFPFYVEYFSGKLESWVRKVISLVDIESNEKVKMVGICGIHRSAIARAVCNVIARHFENLWNFSSVYSSSILPRYGFRKILVILEIPDGAEELDQLQEIIKYDLYCEGSRIIVTASDKNLLVTNGIKIIMDDIEEDQNDQWHKLREKINKRKREDTESHT